MSKTASNLERQTQLSLSRLLPRLEASFGPYIKEHPEHWSAFRRRLDEHFPELFQLYFHIYSAQYDFYYHLEDLLNVLAKTWCDRPEDLKFLDERREANRDWFQSNQMLGGVIYVDLFAGNLQGVRERIPYFKELGLTYLHLMPLFKVPQGENDGGYAVSSYREINPALGSMEGLADLALELRQNGISLVVDLVFNHTASDHAWATQAVAGDLDYQDYYRIFPDRQMPDAYEKYLREIFPDEHPGAFTFSPEMGQWVWTTFHSYQWDLNYANPVVFNRMAEEMLFLANQGVEILRLDAVAFIWKELGTGCENLPKAHQLIQAFNAVGRIAAPGLLFKSEAIVHPDEVIKYIRSNECQLSYNPLLMALLWESLATRNVQLLSQAVRERHKLPAGTSWVNYIRCHDDIGWTFSNEDAARLGINGFDHRKFLNDFYTGIFPGSFARGLPFQENPKTGDMRISGTCASLAGIEKAIRQETETEVDLAVRRILLLHAIILTVGGIPLLYLGDEIGVLNDYDYRKNPAKAGDSRWVHRPSADWERYEKRHDLTTLEGRIYHGFCRLIELRKKYPVFSGTEIQVIDTGNPRVFAYVRSYENMRAVVFANFSEREQTIPDNLLRLYGIGYKFTDLLGGAEINTQNITLLPYDFRALATLA
jgi:amylosucrase